MNDIMRNHGQKKSNQSRKAGTAEDKSSAAIQVEEPLSRHKHMKNFAADSEGGRLPQNGDSTRLKRHEKRSLLKGLFGLLGKRQEEPPEEAENSDKFSAPAPAGWTPQEKRMLANIAELHGARVADIMIPRSDIEALEVDKTLAEALQLFEQSGHSRMPVYAETLDDPRGMIHIRDLLNYITRTSFGSADTGSAISAGNGKNGAKNEGGGAEKAFTALDLKAPISKLGIIRDVLFVPASMQAGRLLARMQASRTQMALVIDEHGGTDGLVSMEDIVELIVGDIEDEHDEEDADIIKEAQDSWIINAAAELEELKDRLGVDFAEIQPAETVDTIGGFIVTALDRIPARGEKVEIMPDYIFQILDADRRRIKRIRLIRLKPPAKA